MLSLALALVLTVDGGVAFSAAATTGVITEAHDQPASVTAVLAVEASASVATPVGTVSGRAAPLVQPDGLRDLGSFIELERSWAADRSVAVRVEPFNPNLHLVTFDWANAIGRRFPETTGVAPVASSRLRLGDVGASLALRASRGFDVLLVDVVGGASFQVGRWSFEARGARLSHGESDLLQLLGRHESMWTAFGAGRISWASGVVDPPLDLVVYGSDPRRFERFFRVPTFESTTLAVAVSLEGGAGGQRLRDGSTFSTMKIAALLYADAQLRVRLGHTRFSLVARTANAEFLLADVLGFPRQMAVPSDSSPWLVAIAALEHTFLGPSLTPGVVVRVWRPAYLTRTIDFGGAPPPQFIGARLLIIEGRFVSPLLPDMNVDTLVAMKFSLRWTPVEQFGLFSELEVKRDQRVSLVSTAATWSWTGQLFVQARF